MNKWIERAAIITGTLGFIGVLMVFFITLKEHLNPPDKKLTTINKLPVTINPATKDTPNKGAVAHTPLKSINNKTDLVGKPKQEKEVEKVAAPINKIEKAAPTGKKAVSQKLLTKEELSDLYDAIAAQQSIKSNMLNCVKILSLQGSNNKKATRQVEQYLTRKHVIITGRETIKKSRKGIYIESAGNCIIVTIGTL